MSSLAVTLPYLQVYKDGRAHTGHQFKDRCLCFPEQTHNFLQALQQRVVVADRPSHASSQAIAQVMVDVELAR